MNTKVCKQCGIDKNLNDFYSLQSNSDGKCGKCKECIKSNVKANRIANHEHYLAFDRARQNRPDRVLARHLYSKTKQGINTSNKAKNKWSENNQIKRAASYIVNNAVRDNKIIKPDSCFSCSRKNVRLEGHHVDYAKPLEVMWMCSKCHREWHKHNKPINGD